MRHVARFRCGDEDLAVRTKAHAFRLDADLDLAERNAPLQVDYCDRVVVFVGHIQNLAGVILRKQLGIWTRGQIGDDLVRSYVDDLYRVVVSDGHQNEFSVPGQLDAARSLADLDRLHDGEFVGIDHTDGVALFVRDIGSEGARLGADQNEDAHGEQPIARPREVETPSPQKTPGVRRHQLFEPALTFGTVDPERIQFRNLMQKSFLWRH